MSHKQHVFFFVSLTVVLIVYAIIYIYLFSVYQLIQSASCEITPLNILFDIIFMLALHFAIRVCHFLYYTHFIHFSSETKASQFI